MFEKYIDIVKILYGGIYILLGLYIMLKSLFLPNQSTILSGDPGYAFVIVSIGIVSLAYSRSGDLAKEAGSLFIGSVLSTALLGVRLIVIISRYLDSIISSTYFDLMSAFSYVEIYTSVITSIVLIYSYKTLRRYTF